MTPKNNFKIGDIVTVSFDLSGRRSEKEYNKALEEVKMSVEQITDSKGANYFVAHINDYANLGNSIILHARELFTKKVASLKLKYDKESKQYEDPQAS